LKVSVKNQGKAEKIIYIEVPKERVQSEFDKVYREIAKEAKIPGFRPGKAPRDVLVTHYADKAKEDVLNNLVQEMTREAIQQEKLEPIYYPSVDKVDFKGDKLSFEAIIEVKPEVKLGSFKGLKAKKKSVEVKDKDIDEQITRLRESFGTFAPVENRAVKEGDFMICDLESEVEGKKLDSKKDEWLEVDSKKAYPELVKGVLGMKPEETRTVDVNFPKDHPTKDHAGKVGKFTIQLKEVKERKLPELTDEWVKTMGGEIESVEALKTRLKDDMTHKKEGEAEGEVEHQLLDELLKGCKVEVSKAAVKRRAEGLAKDTAKRLKSQGYPDEEISKQSGEIEERMQPEAERQLKLAYIFEEIAKAESLALAEADWEEQYKKIAERSKVEVEKAREYYEGSLEQKEQLEHQLLNEKVLSVIKDNAKIQNA
jgi:trigger factor